MGTTKRFGVSRATITMMIVVTLSLAILLVSPGNSPMFPVGTASAHDAPNNICDRPQVVQDAIRTALDKTHLSCEQVTVHSSDFVTITQLRITGIQLTTLQSGSFYGLTGLRRLEISSCGLDELPEDIFDGLSNLERLDLSSNDLEELPEDIFDGLGNLKKLHLNNNELTALHQDVFDGLSSLEVLGLSSNDLTALPADVFEDLDSLESLGLAQNELGTLPINVFEDIAATLSGLSVGYNDLALGELPSDFFASFTNLTILGLEGIGKDWQRDTEGTMTSLAYDWFDDLSNLERLYLANNELSSLSGDTFGGFSNLELLDLSSNELSSLSGDTFGGFSNLELLDLSSNELSSLPEDTFDGFSNLELLLLGHNDLTELSADLLEDLTNLVHLELQNNQLTALPDGLFKGLSNLCNVDLFTNPGAPFTLTAELEKSGNDGIVVKVAEGAPYTMDVTLSAEGGTLSETSWTIPAGSVQSEVITVTHSGSDVATISVASAAFPVRRSMGGPLPGYLSGTPRGTLAGTGSSLTLSAPSDGESPNTPATGVPTIGGTAQVGQTLTADTSGISEADGLDNVAYNYQWLSNRDTEINGATSSTYTLQASDNGKVIKVRVTFTDDAGNEETLTSTATAAVAAAPPTNNTATGAPTISGTVKVGETLTADTTGISDQDGLDNVQFDYQWLADDTAVSGATASTYTLVAADEGKTVKVKVSFTDDQSNDESRTSAATAAVAAAAGPAALTAEFKEVPDSHDGSNTFTFELRFSEEFPVSYLTLKDDAFTVDGGEVTKARRLDQDSDTPNIRWEITVSPIGDGDVTITLPETTDCADEGAICTEDDRMLSQGDTATVPGPGAVNSPATGTPPSAERCMWRRR